MQQTYESLKADGITDTQILNQYPEKGYRWIYAYSSEAYLTHHNKKYNTALKVGDTTRTVHDRVKVEQDGSQNIEEPIVVFMGQIPDHLRDKDLHDLLHRNGYKKSRDDKDREYIQFNGNVEENIQVLREHIQTLTADKKSVRTELLLTSPQYYTLENAIAEFNSGKRVLLEELCARFGKTPWALALLQSLDEQIMVVPTYVLSALTSFKTDVLKFKEFVDIDYINAYDVDCIKQINSSLQLKKKVVLGVSLFDRDPSKKIVKFLSQFDNKFLFVDEADFGAWRESQIKVINNISDENTKIILASGTNGVRASTNYEVEYFESMTYFDMLMYKHGERKYVPKLGLPFILAGNMNSIPEVEFYQLGFPHIDTSEIAKDNLPLWSKAFENVNKSKGFLTAIFSQLFNGGGDHEYLNLDNVFGGKHGDVQLWLPENIKKTKINQFANFLQDLLGTTWLVVPINGDENTDRGKMNGNNVEEHVRNQIAYANMNGYRGTIVVTSKMGARSFSVPSIDTILLAYDNGSAAQTAQKMSRCLTIGETGKVGKVVSLSLDPTREDKLDAPMLETALSVAKDQNIDINSALRVVLRTLNIYTMNSNGDHIRVNVDEYMKKILSLNSLKKLIAVNADLNTILTDPGMVEQILKMTADRGGLGNSTDIMRTGKKFLGTRGRVKPNPKPETRKEQEALNLIYKIQNAILALVDNINHIVGMSPYITVRDALTHIKNDKRLDEIFEIEFNCPTKFVLGMVEGNVLPVELLDIQSALQDKEDGKKRNALG